MPCRAVYGGDGLEYEAVVQKIIDDTLCLVRFIGKNIINIMQAGFT